MKHLLRAVAGMTVALAFFSGTELVMRALLGPPPPAIPVYDAIGERDAYLSIADGQVERLFGKDGLPGFAVEAEGKRIAVLGGSSVHGGSPRVGVDDEFPARVGRLLDVEVLNLGSPGLDSHDLVRLLGELAPVDLDLLVVYSGHNDFGNTFFENRYGDVGSAVFAYTHRALGHLQLYAQLSLLVRPLSGSTRRSHEEDHPPNQQVPPMSPERLDLALQAFKANLDRLAWMTEQRGLEMVVVVPVCKLAAPPAPSECTPGECPRDRLQEARRIAAEEPDAAVAILRDLRDHDPLNIRAPTAAQQAVRELAAAHAHVRLIDPFEALPRDHIYAVPDRRLFVDPVHFSHRGHREMAELIAGRLEEQL